MLKVRAFFYCACFLSSSVALAQDQCKDILSDGVRDIISTSGNSDERSSTKEWFCSAEFEKYSSSYDSGLTFSIPLPDGEAKFGDNSSEQSSNQRREDFCKSDAAQFSDRQVTTVYRRVASADVVAAWRDCMTIGSVGIVLKANRIDPQSFVLTASWTPSFTGQQAPVVDEIDVEGAECEQESIVPGTVLTIEPIRQICEQTERIKAFATMKTDVGDFVAEIARDLTGIPAGDVSLLYFGTREYWAPGPLRSERRGTGNHHCSSNCRGEPTRTTYTIQILALEDERFVDPVVLKCIGGPCGGWNSVGAVRNEGVRAHGTFDVWSRPTTWELTVGSEVRLREVVEFQSSTFRAKYGEPFTISIPQGDDIPRLKIEASGETRLLSLSDDKRVEVVSKESQSGQVIYTINLLPD